MAPEVALRQPYNEKVDIFSFGMILWQMLHGAAPFKGMKREDLLTLAMYNILFHISEFCRRLLNEATISGAVGLSW